MRYVIVALAVCLLTGCAGKSKVELWLRNKETKMLEHQATMYAEGKCKGSLEIAPNIKGEIDSKTPPLINIPKIEMKE